jgi:hypothetical protein
MKFLLLALVAVKYVSLPDGVNSRARGRVKDFAETRQEQSDLVDRHLGCTPKSDNLDTISDNGGN